jgi:cold-inducible RNA-binding protein
VFVGNLSFRTTQDELTAYLSQAGQIVDVHIPTDRESGRPRGFAFVEFSSEAEAAEAIKLFDGKELGGRSLKVNAAEDRAPRGGGGPRPHRFQGDGGDRPFGGGGGKPFKNKGSRRGLRARKRSL